MGALHLAVLVACAALIAAETPQSLTVTGAPPNPCTAASCVPVFYPGLNGSKCYRIPSVIQTYKGTLLAFAENRIDGCGDQGKHDLVVRRSTDSGKTWGPMIVVFVGVVPCPGCPAAVSNPNPVEVTLDNGSRAVLLAFDTMNNPSSAHHGLDMRTWSSDDGLSWTNASTVAFPPEKNIGSLIGPAVGLQADDGTLFFWITTGFLAISKDHGATFTASQRAPVHSECSIAFANSPSNSTLIMNCRTGDHHRAQFYWRPNGSSYASSGPTYPPQLTDANCQGSITNVGGTLYTSNAGSTAGRERMTIHRSDDQGGSWSEGQVLHDGPSGYSQLVPLQTKDRSSRHSSGAPPSQDALPLGVLFEAGTSSYTDTISFASFEWSPAPPAPRADQQWTHNKDGTLTTGNSSSNRLYCLDWSVKSRKAYMSACSPSEYPHQRWTFDKEGHLVSMGSDAGKLVLDWTVKISADGAHAVYMHEAASNYPHQLWKLTGQALSSGGGSGLCLGWVTATATTGSGTNPVEMSQCV